MGSTANGRTTANVGSGDATVKAGKGTVIGIAILIAAAGETLVLKNGGVSGNVKVTVQGDVGGVFIPMNVHFEVDIFADIAGTTARYLIVYD